MDHEMNGQAGAKPQGLFLNIPLEIARRDDLTQCAKLAYGAINTLCRINGGLCTASNEYMSDLVGIYVKSFKRALTLLVKKKLVVRVMHGQARESLSIAKGGDGGGGQKLPAEPPPAVVAKRLPSGKLSRDDSGKWGVTPGSELPQPMGSELPQGLDQNDPTVGSELPQAGVKIAPPVGSELPQAGVKKVGSKLPPLIQKRETLQVSLSSQTHADAREASAGPSAREAPGPASARRKKTGKTGTEIEAERRAMDASMRETRRVEQHIADLSEAPMDDPIIRREMEARAAGEMAVLLPDPATTPPVEIVRPHVIAMRAALEARKAGGQ